MAVPRSACRLQAMPLCIQYLLIVNLRLYLYVQPKCAFLRVRSHYAARHTVMRSSFGAYSPRASEHVDVISDTIALSIVFAEGWDDRSTLGVGTHVLAEIPAQMPSACTRNVIVSTQAWAPHHHIDFLPFLLFRIVYSAYGSMSERKCKQ